MTRYCFLLHRETEKKKKKNQEGYEFVTYFREELGDKIRTNHWPETGQKCTILHVILSTETIKVVSATVMGSNATDGFCITSELRRKPTQSLYLCSAVRGEKVWPACVDAIGPIQMSVI